MRIVLNLALAAALAGSLYAGDDHKETVKVEGRDAVTGEKVKHKSKTKVESDGDFKTKSRTKVDGDTVEKTKTTGEADGDYKSKTKSKTIDGKQESKVKVDK